MRYFYTILIVFLLLLQSCKTLKIVPVNQSTTPVKLLGSVGEAKTFLLERDYYALAIPNYNEGIKLEVGLKAFTKAAFKKFKKAQEQSINSIVVAYVDSLNVKPNYMVLQIADRVAILNALNNIDNKDVKAYLTNKQEAHIVSTISIAFNRNDMKAILNADEVFLEKEGVKSYALKLYKNKVLESTINFNQGVVFGYKSAGMCWQEDDKYQLQIVDFAEDGNRCPKGTYSSAKRAKKKVDYYKF